MRTLSHRAIILLTIIEREIVMGATLSDFLIQLAGFSAIGGFSYLIYSLNHSDDKNSGPVNQYE